MTLCVVSVTRPAGHPDLTCRHPPPTSCGSPHRPVLPRGSVVREPDPELSRGRPGPRIPHGDGALRSLPWTPVLWTRGRTGDGLSSRPSLWKEKQSLLWTEKTTTKFYIGIGGGREKVRGRRFTSRLCVEDTPSPDHLGPRDRHRP